MTVCILTMFDAGMRGKKNRKNADESSEMREKKRVGESKKKKGI